MCVLCSFVRNAMIYMLVIMFYWLIIQINFIAGVVFRYIILLIYLYFCFSLSLYSSPHAFAKLSCCLYFVSIFLVVAWFLCRLLLTVPAHCLFALNAILHTLWATHMNHCMLSLKRISHSCFHSVSFEN